MPNIAALTAANAARWAKANIAQHRMTEVQRTAQRLCAPDNKRRYQAIGQAVWGRPERWAFVAVVHEREAGGPPHWDRQLGQGDPLAEVSRHVPRGVGPFYAHPGDVPGADAFHRCAVFTLARCPPFPARWTDWSIGGVLTLLELFNGTGYEDYHHEASPYIWGATDQEEWGKYVGDGIWHPRVWDTQIGAAAMLKAMMLIDSSVHFEEAA